MRKRRKQAVSLLLSVCVFLTMLPAMALASGDISYQYWVEASGWQTGTKAAGEYEVIGEGDVQWGIDGGETWYVVSGDVDICNSTGANTSMSDVEVRGKVHLILTDNSTLTCKRIITKADSSLYIYAQSENENTMGKLIAEGGIGADSSVDTNADIVIHGGNIEAKSDALAAIGSDQGGYTVIGYGGVITANAQYSACIYADKVNLQGCRVNVSSEWHNGICGGEVTLKDGNITISAAASNGIYSSGDIRISGGSVKVEAGNGENPTCGILAGGTLEITGQAKVDVINNGTSAAVEGASGIIISGSEVSSVSKSSNGFYTEDKIQVKDGAKVTTQGVYPAIWTRNGVEIDGSTVQAESSRDVGIYSPGTATISDSVVMAKGGGSYQGILVRTSEGSSLSGSWVDGTYGEGTFGSVENTMSVGTGGATVTGTVVVPQDAVLPQGTKIKFLEGGSLVINNKLTIVSIPSGECAIVGENGSINLPAGTVVSVAGENVTVPTEGGSVNFDGNVNIYDISLDRDSVEIPFGDTTVLKATVRPAGTKVSWSSDNEDIAVVENGTIEGKGEGTAVITAKVGNMTAQCQVVVGHKWSEKWENDNSFHWHNCAAGEKCNIAANDNGKKEGYGEHEGEWIIDKEPTTETEGSKYRVCSKCSFKETAVIAVEGTPAPGTEPEPEETPEVTTDPNPEETPEATTDPNPEETPGATTDPKPEETPEATTDPNPEETPGATTDPKPEETPEATTDPNPEETPGATTDPNPEETPGATTDPKPEETPEASTSPKPEETPEATPGSEPEETPETPSPEPEETPEASPSPEPSHKHSWSGAWKSDSRYHWHECIADNCNLFENSGKEGYGEHVPGDWIIDKFPVADAVGSKHRECVICAFITETSEIPATGNQENSGNPFIQDDTGKKGWTAVKEAVEKTAENGAVNIVMNGAATVPGELLDIVKDREITLTFDMGDGFSWTVNGKQVTEDKVGDINLSVTKGAGEIPEDIIRDVAAENTSIKFSLAHSGDFGFTATLSLNLGKENQGCQALLYYYNQDTKRLESVGQSLISETGTAKFVFTHASDYVAVIERTSDSSTPETDSSDSQSTDTDRENVPTSPRTGESTDPLQAMYGFLVVLVGMGVFAFLHMKRKG